MELRPYQIKIISDLRENVQKNIKKNLIVSPCGSGKSVVLSQIIKNATSKGNNVLFLVHRKELCEQIEETLGKFNVDMNLCNIYMVQTATRRLDKIKEPSIIIVDEVHHILSASYMRIIEYFNKAILLGFTATPIRMNEGGLGKVFESMIKTVSVKWLIDNNYLSQYKYYGVNLADLSNVKIKHGDYDIEEINKIMQNNIIYGETVSNWEKLALNKKTIIYCSSVKASMETVEQFKINGYTAEHIDGITNKNTRAEIIAKFRNGEIKIISNVDILGEGFDVPDCECVILLRPTKSLSLFIQQSMRSLRKSEDKIAIIIDHVSNIYEHGFPDEDRVWTLETKKKKKKGEKLIKECPECFACLNINVTICSYCGYVFTTESKKTKDLIEAELVELKKEHFKKTEYVNYKDIKTFEEMCIFQKARGYKFGWVIRMCSELNISIPSKYNYYKRRFIQ